MRDYRIKCCQQTVATVETYIEMRNGGKVQYADNTMLLCFEEATLRKSQR
jgi:hypothetical protein